MKIRVALIGLVVLCVTFGVIGTATAKPAGEGAFLIESATSVSQVVDQVERSRLVALRYAKHFRTDPSSVLSYFRKELEIATLSENTTLTVYYLDESRNIVGKTTELKAGTKVFANKAGIPILQYGTGNPLSATLTTEAPIRDLSNVISATPGQETVVTQVLEQPPTQLTTTPLEQGTMVAANVPGTTLPAGAGSSSLGASLPGWIVPVGILGAAAAFGGGGGGGAPGGGAGGSSDNEPHQPLIPEPAGVLALGTSLLALAGLACRKRK
ncbi:MAG TPA: hypothetical protein VMX94_11180 [Armatimonadota bacterium]|nr:hypothetical protein [Armatimonadota bacterium]